MNKILVHAIRCLAAVLLVMAILLSPAPQIAKAQTPTCAPGVDSPDCVTGDPGLDLNSQSTVTFSKFYLKTMKGDYTAHGIGMRNAGHGNINITDIKPGSTVVAAYLYWAIHGPVSVPGYNYARGVINGATITGTRIGSSPSPCWRDQQGNSLTTWSYRADVKSKMYPGGNGVYYLSDFASGAIDGGNPWGHSLDVPMIDGVSLVIFFSNPNLPNTTFYLYNGSVTAGNEYAQTEFDLHLTIPGVKAVAPTGFSKTTFIGSGMKKPAASPTYFFTDPVGPGWTGADPLSSGVGPFQFGNLWDTMTVDLHSLIKAPETDFSFTTKVTSFSCITWVAQVLSYSNGNQDTDGDKLLDGWELNGFDPNGDGFSEVPLPAYGSDPLHKDIFVQANYMNDSSGNDYSLPAVAELNDLVTAFNNAPVANPDGINGIHLHIDTGGTAYGSLMGSLPYYDLGGGSAVGIQANLGTADTLCKTYDWSDFQTLKNLNFDPNRAPIFHYVIFAYNLAPTCGTMSGISRNAAPDSSFIKGSTDFIVSLGGWTGHGTSKEREGVFMHELGHNLGLRNGGNDQVINKPNYISLMNPLFETTGVPAFNGSGISWIFDYSRFLLPSLNENALNEVKGLGPLASGYYTEYFCGGPFSTTTGATANNPINWNCDGDATDTSVKVDINGDGKFTTLGTQNNWASINFSGNGVIGNPASVSLASAGISSMELRPILHELTNEENQKIHGAVGPAGP